jgi:outer membrane autotransporter protein
MTHSARGSRSRSPGRVLRVAPTTRAIRAALAASATLLALSGSSVALAGTCTTGTPQIVCNGVFTDDVINSVNPSDVVQDLTLVVGTDGSTTVDPGLGTNGITSTWGGDAVVINYADIHTNQADGVYMSSAGTATVANYGSISVDTSKYGNNAIDASGAYGVTVVNGGSLLVTGAGVGVRTVVAYSYGDVEVDNLEGGYIGAVSDTRYAVGVTAVSYGGDVTIDNAGIIEAAGFAEASGVIANAGGDATVVNSGRIDAFSTWALAEGVVALSGSVATVQNLDGSEVNAVSGYFDAIGVFAQGPEVLVDNAGAITADASSRATGVYAFAGNGDITLDNSGSIYAESRFGRAYGASLIGNGDIGVDNSGDITAISHYNNAAGMLLQSGAGDIYANNSGSIHVGGSGYATGIVSLALGGDSYIYNSGDIDASAVLVAQGINAGGDNVTVVNAGSVSAQAQFVNAHAIVAITSGDAAVSNSGLVTAYTDYGYAAGILVASSDLYGQVTVDNSGDIVVRNDHAVAQGIYAIANGGYMQVDSSGSIVVTGDDYAAGIAAAIFSDGDLNVDNSGSIEAHSAHGPATGINALSQGYGTVDVLNSGDVVAASDYSTAAGIRVVTRYGNAYLDNSGSIDASSIFGSAYGALVRSNYGDALANNSGDIVSGSSYGLADGLVVQSLNGDVAAYSSGSILAVGNSAYGIVAHASNGAVLVDNSGQIGATARGTAMGILAIGLGGVTVDNSGDVAASSQTGAAEAINISSNGDVVVTNSGSLYAHADSFASLGIAISGFGYDSSITVDNSGSIVVSNVNGNAIGIAGASASYIDVANSGSISATAGAYATGIYVQTFGNGDVGVDNSGSIEANAGAGNANGIIADALGYGSVYIVNSGDILAASEQADGTGINVSAYTGYLYVDNSGSVSAYGNFATGMDVRSFADADIAIISSGSVLAEAGARNGNGIFAAASYYGTVDVLNQGDITVAAGAYATGINVRVNDGDATVGNEGSVSVEAVNGRAAGILVRANGDAGIAIDNSGEIAAYSEQSGAHAIYALARGDGDIVVSNSGDLSASGYLFGFGMNLNSLGAGDIDADNSGSIYASSTHDAFGIEVALYGTGSTSIDNGGDIEAQALNGKAVAVHASALAGDFYLYNGGTLAAESVYGDAFGVEAHADDNAADVEVVNAGSISAYSHQAIAIGVFLTATGDGSVVQVDNSGSISALATYSNAFGVIARSDGEYGTAYVTNSGDIGAQSAYYSAGVSVGGDQLGELDNSGAIHATTANEAGSDATAVGVSAFGFTGDGYVLNEGTVDASASSTDGYALARGVSVGSYYGHGYLHNYGAIGADAQGAYARALGAVVTSELNSAAAYNDGDVVASAQGDVAAAAFGLYAGANEFSLVDNGGSIVASASAHDEAFAAGAVSYGTFANVYSTGDIAANASADAAEGLAKAYGAITSGAFSTVHVYEGASVDASASGYAVLAVGSLQYGGFTGFHNEGSISASADGSVGGAIGAHIESYFGVDAYNDGSIAATASGAQVSAFGLVAYSDYGNLVVHNYGSISASADYAATGVWLDTDNVTAIFNYGSIVASGAEHSYAIDTSTGASTDYIVNYGTISGPILTGAGNDELYNAVGATWYASGYSDFGDGDDSIWNYGLIAMTDASIDLGFHDVEGNHFGNFGVLSVQGDNFIDMGDGALDGGDTLAPALVPSANPNAFYNGGVIDFQDGDTDDVLTITGDFAGDGDINVDVSGLDGSADLLYIDGSVVDGTAATINVNLLDLPESLEALVPVVLVSGDSAEGNFSIGNVNWTDPGSFVTLDFDVVADIDASNATPDVFSLGISVSGLSDAGAIAAAIPSTVAGLMNAQVGTWRQRMGVIDRFDKGGISLWARAFYERGDVSPERSLGGNFDYEQLNSGAEGGVDFAVTDEFSLGLLVASSRGKSTLEEGNGAAKVEADTWGVYGTWISPNGFYLDASWRWMDFDVSTESSAGVLEGDGDAEAFNIEAGYAWSLSGGLKIEPQLQYTKTRVDNLSVLVSGTGMSFGNEGGDSSRGRVGVALRKSFGDADSGWLWTPYASLSAVREFDGESRFAVNDAFFSGTTVEGTSALLELGATVRQGNWSLYGGLNWQDGGAIDSLFGGQLGARYTFGGAAPAPAPVAPPPAKTCADLDDDGDGIDNCNDKCAGSGAGQAVGADGCPLPPPPEPVVEPKPYRN